MAKHSNYLWQVMRPRFVGPGAHSSSPLSREQMSYRVTQRHVERGERHVTFTMELRIHIYTYTYKCKYMYVPKERNNVSQSQLIVV